MRYKYQMHMHTSPCSKCGAITPAELAKALYEGGYAGGVITNHFLRGNTGIDRKLPWEEFVQPYIDDYLELKKEAEKFDLDIIFCIEEGIGGGKEFFPYGLSPETLKEHSELRYTTLDVWRNVVHNDGGLIIQAHPFRHRDYIVEPGLSPIELLDGYELYNFCNDELGNLEAEEQRKKYPQFVYTSGGDAHSAEIMCHGGIETDRRIHNEKELADILRKGTYNLIKE